MELVEVSKDKTKLLKLFLETAGDSLKTFRYFNTRPLEIINSHLITYLILEKESPICYGHLDSENGITWLGIAVKNGFKGKGYGRLMMENLLKFAAENKIKNIHLSVDNGNTEAIGLYQKFGFIMKEMKDKTSIYTLQ